MSWENVINAASAAWKVVEDNRPSAEINSSTANAVPDVDDWTALVHDGRFNKLMFGMHYDNLAGFEVVGIDIELFWQFGATYRGGGAFIPNLWISVPKCDVFWGQTINLELTCRNPSNGNASDPSRPIASLPVTVSGTVENMFQVKRIEWNFVINGDGRWQQI